jgi:micrococcal nuclease
VTTTDARATTPASHRAATTDTRATTLASHRAATTDARATTRRRAASGHAAALGVAIATAVLPGCSDAGPICGPGEASVERVIDGDTIEITGAGKIRYLLVDAPELTGGRAGCFGSNALRFNTDLVLGKPIQLTYDVVCQDAHGRTLAYVTVDGQDVNRILVERGYACVLHIPPDGDARARELTAVEASARSARRGLWGSCDPTPCRGRNPTSPTPSRL